MAKSKNKANSKAKPKAGKAISNRKTGEYANNSNKMVLFKSLNPVVLSTSQGLRVRNTEYFMDVNGIDVTNYQYNFFNPTSRPWLGNIAKCYQKYRVHALTFSFVPIAATSQAGSIDFGTFYDADDVGRWATLGGPDNLYTCSEYASGPLYAGGAVNTNDNRVRDDNWFGITCDTRAAHRTYPWLIVDTGSPINETENLSRAVSLAVRCYATGFTLSSKVGRVLVSYDVEFIQTVAPLNQPVVMTGAAQRLPDYFERWPVGTGPTKPPKPEPELTPMLESA